MTSELFLIYRFRGKQFVVAKDNSEIHKLFRLDKKLIIGSDSDLLWQVFDKKFPAKHVFIEKGSDGYYVNLLSSMSIDVKEGDKALSLEELKNKGILKNNKLYLKQGLKGSIHVNDFTEISFMFVRGAVPLTEREKRMVADFTKKPPLKINDKVNRAIIILVVFLVSIFAAYMNIGYKPYVRKSVFDEAKDLAVREFSVAMELHDEPIDEPIFEEEVETVDDINAKAAQEAEVKVKAEQKAKTTAKAKADVKNAIKSQLKNRKKYVSNGAAGGSGGGTGKILAYKSGISGLKGGSKRASTFSGVEVSSSSNLSDKINRMKAARGQNTGAALTSDGGISVAAAGGKQAATIDINKTTNYGKLASNVGDGQEKVQETQEEYLAAVQLEKDRLKALKKKRVKLTISEKNAQINDWFSSVDPDISSIYNNYRKSKPIRGILKFQFYFKNDIIVNVKITGKGSINDKKFIARLKKFLKGKEVLNMGSYSKGVVTRNFE